MKFVFLLLLLVASLSFSWAREECDIRVTVGDAERIASRFVGDVREIKLRKRKKAEGCYYVVKGKGGTILIDAYSGEPLRFKRRFERR